YVGLESKHPSATPYTKAKGKWLDATDSTGDKSPSKIFDTLASGGNATKNNRTEGPCWGDVWNYARLYRHEKFDKDGMTMNTADDAYARSNEKNLDPEKNVTDLQNRSPWREPVITQLQVEIGFLAELINPAS